MRIDRVRLAHSFRVSRESRSKGLLVLSEACRAPLRLVAAGHRLSYYAYHRIRTRPRVVAAQTRARARLLKSRLILSRIPVPVSSSYISNIYSQFAFFSHSPFSLSSLVICCCIVARFNPRCTVNPPPTQSTASLVSCLPSPGSLSLLPPSVVTEKRNSLGRVASLCRSHLPAFVLLSLLARCIRLYVCAGFVKPTLSRDNI